MAVFGLSRPRARLAVALASLVLFGGVAAPAMAVAGTGSIKGSVTRPAEMGLLCAEAWLVGAASSSAPAGSSCAVGQSSYSIDGLATGDYIV